jgi:hypothetical protein
LHRHVWVQSRDDGQALGTVPSHPEKLPVISS